MTNNEQAEVSDDDFWARFTLVRQWPEQVGSRAWRKRASKEMSSAEIELFFHETLQLEDLNDAERTSIFQELEAFNAARERRHKRDSFLRGLIEAVDALGGILSLFAVAGLVGLFIAPSLLGDHYFVSWLYLHWAIALAWCISLVIRVPRFIRDWRAGRAGDKIDFARMKQEVVFANGQYLKGEYTPKSSDEIAIGNTIGWGLNVFFLVFVIGFAGAINEPGRFVPLWLAIVLMILGVIGTLLLAHARTLAERVQGEWDRDRARAAAAASPPPAS